jgi:hypothetical protein
MRTYLKRAALVWTAASIREDVEYNLAVSDDHFNWTLRSVTQPLEAR